MRTNSPKRTAKYFRKQLTQKKEKNMTVAFKKILKKELKKEGKNQQSIQSSTTPDPRYHMGK